ncbi:MAG: enoyl-CoA hydratase [Thermodesulfobacteriota bacterium]|nr:enoyl-CoA hydratase [Thermodesulfobacteriota bacterium]
MEKEILLEKKESVALITLNRPEVLNAFSFEMREGLAVTFESLAEDDDVRAVVITGAGRAFSAGGDIKGWGDLKDENKMKKIMGFVHQALKSITTMHKPVIAMVNGDAVGAGCNLALACDMVIASENARFGEVFVRIGLGPDWGGAFFLPRLIGMAKAKELLFTGKIITAQQALEMGLINKVVPADELESTTMKLAQKLSQSATRAIGMTKNFLHKTWLMDLEEALEYEAFMQKELMKTTDHQEAVKAFLNKTKPTFSGK